MTVVKNSSLDALPLQVLLVDDDEDSYVLTRDFLSEVRGQRYILDWAKNAQAGVAAVEAGNFDVALVDFYLGAYNGDAVIAELRRRKSAVPLILLTSEDSRQNDVAVMDAGADDFLVKGLLNPVVLERAIRFALQRRAHSTALAASEERFRELFESNLDAVLVTEPTGAILAANPAAEVLFRRTESEIKARGRSSLIADEDRADWAQLDARMSAGAFRDELLLRRGDGTTFTAEVSVATANEMTGGRASVIIRDVSARRAIEHNLAKTERRLRRFEAIGPWIAGAAIVGMLALAVSGNPLTALLIGAGVIIAQAWLRMFGTRRRTSAFSGLAEWREKADDARRGLSHYTEYLQVDPGSGLGTSLAMQRAVERQLASFRRNGEVFSLVLIEITDAESSRRELTPNLVLSASKALSVLVTAEESLCRMNANTFGILLPGRDRAVSTEFVEQFRHRFGNKIRGNSAHLKIVFGAAEVSDNVTKFEQLFEKAIDDLENYDRDLAYQVSQFSGVSQSIA